MKGATRGGLGRPREIKGLAVSVHDSITKPAAVALAVLATIAPYQLRAEPFDRLGVFVAGVIDRLDATGALNVGDYDCEAILPDLQECRDPLTNLSFLHLPTPEGANVSLMVVKGSAIDGKDLALPDRASGDQMLAVFKALPDTALAGRDRCALLEGATDTDGLVLGIKPPLGNYPVYLIQGGLDDAAVATLDRAGGEGEILSAILVVVVAAEGCKPLG